MVSVFLYDLAVSSYFFFIKIASLFDQKAKLWVRGRRDLFKKLASEINAKRKENQPLIWVHCASLGEFEQGRPVIEKIKKEHPHIFVYLTFFSPSGFEIRKNYQHADLVGYLPTDSRRNAKRFLQIIQPDVAIFVKYEFWFHFLRQLTFQKVPIFLIAAVFRKEQPFFKRWGSLHRKMLQFFSEILVQEENSAVLLKGIGLESVVCGDPRVDRVISIAKERKQLPFVEAFCGERPVFVCGSTWPTDENCLKQIWGDEAFSEWKFIIAPHDISEKRLGEVEHYFPKSLTVRYSQLAEGKPAGKKRVLIIDNIGLLSSIYFYGKIAYIGGGFGSGIHNILEPMTFGLPVFFGSNFKKFTEAKRAVEQGCGFSIKDGDEIQEKFKHVIEGGRYAKIRQAAFALIDENKGATVHVLTHLKKYLD